MRIGFISDVHYGPPTWFEGKLAKLTQFADELTLRFVERMNREFRPDLGTAVIRAIDVTSGSRACRDAVDPVGEQVCPHGVRDFTGNWRHEVRHTLTHPEPQDRRRVRARLEHGGTSNAKIALLGGLIADRHVFERGVEERVEAAAPRPIRTVAIRAVGSEVGPGARFE